VEWLEARRLYRLGVGMGVKSANGRWIRDAAWSIARRRAALAGEPFEEPVP
jgi:hypothetical protein